MALSISAVVDDLRNVLNPKPGVSPDEDLDDGVPERPKKVKKLAAPQVPDEDGDVEMDDLGNEDYQMMGDDEPQDEEESVSGTIGDDEREQDDGWESGSLSGGAVVEDGETSEDEDVAMAPSSSKLSRPTPAASKTKSAAAGQSTFLPSLAVGFVRGESGDSDWSDGEADVADVEPRKNRRGQRARQA